MIQLEKVGTLIELALFSAYIQNEKPVSAIITAPPEAGKTEVLMQYAENKGIVTLTDCTAYGIMRDYGDDIKARNVRHLIIPDLVRPMSRGKDTVHGLVAFLNALIEEGVISVSTYAETIGKAKPGEEQPVPVKCGLIATLAEDILKDGRHHWAQMGFMSRLVPISYTYSVQTRMAIQKSIVKREYLGSSRIELKLPDRDVLVGLDEKEATELLGLSGAITASSAGANPERVYGFRLQKHVQRLAMASALRLGRDKVTKEDVELLSVLASCMNLEYYPL